MKYEVKENIRIKTSKTEMELLPGQIVTLPHDKAMQLLNEGRITPLEMVAYKVYSEALECNLWVVDTDKDMHTLREQGIKTPVYLIAECKKLKGVSREHLKAVHEVKKVFEGATVEQVIKKESENV
jgi:hypothetical protein